MFFGGCLDLFGFNYAPAGPTRDGIVGQQVVVHTIVFRGCFDGVDGAVPSVFEYLLVEADDALQFIYVRFHRFCERKAPL
jgi:hypothetical protein